MSTAPDVRTISQPSPVGSSTPWLRTAGYAVVVAGVGAAGVAFGLWGNERIGPRDPAAQRVAVADPGGLTTSGLPIVKLVVVVAVVGTIGMLVAALLLPRQDGRFGEPARRCLRSAGWLAVTWAVAMAALLVLSWSDVARVPVTMATVYQIFSGPEHLPYAVPYLYSAWLAVVIAAGAFVLRNALGVAALLLLCGYTVLPLTMRGQQVHGAAIGLVVTVHVLAIAVWVGTLAALLAHARRSPASLAVAAPRFSRLALACFVVVGAFGLTAAWINLGSLSALGGSHFGTLVVYKVEAFVALGLFGWWHRRRTIPEIRQKSSIRPFVRFAAIEVMVMVAAIGLGIALSRASAPAAPIPVTHKPNPYTGVMGP
ncbi:MAG TPA: CopD family protein [Streptosporangiaceae bacterium]